MSLLNFFKRADGGPLPRPTGPLSKVMPSTAIASANKIIRVLEPFNTLDKPSATYQKYTTEDRAPIGRKAAIDGIASATSPLGSLASNPRLELECHCMLLPVHALHMH